MDWLVFSLIVKLFVGIGPNLKFDSTQLYMCNVNHSNFLTLKSDEVSSLSSSDNGKLSAFKSAINSCFVVSFGFISSAATSSVNRIWFEFFCRAPTGL